MIYNLVLKVFTASTSVLRELFQVLDLHDHAGDIYIAMDKIFDQKIRNCIPNVTITQANYNEFPCKTKIRSANNMDLVSWVRLNNVTHTMQGPHCN